MKTLKLLSGCLAAAWIVACASDSEEALFEQPECAEPVSLNQDIMPLLQTNCAVEFCHQAESGLPDFSVKANVLEHADRIRTRTREGTMPPPGSGLTLTNEEINRISCWVEQGKMDN